MNVKTLSVILSIFILFAASCDNDSKTGVLSVRLTDAPFPTDTVQEANVTITKIEARQGGEHQGSPFVVLSEEEMTFNLLNLTNGVTAQLTELNVPAGEYNLIRIQIKEASVLLKGLDEPFDLKVPSGASSGLKIFIKPSIVVSGGLTSELLLDFDVSRSFVPNGNAKSFDGFIFKPVIKATNNSTAGRLVGNVTSNEPVPIEGATISIYTADTLNTATLADADGNYTALGLEAGTYKVVAEAEGFVSQTIETIQIVAANATTQDFTLEEAAQ